MSEEGAFIEPLGCYMILERSGGAVKRIIFSIEPPQRHSEMAEAILKHSRCNIPPGIEMDLSGLTAFQREVFAAVGRIPPGRTLTYGQVAELIGRPGAARAVGRALASNPFPVLIPCHRVVSKRDLGGYRWGRTIKENLLAMERSLASPG